MNRGRTIILLLALLALAALAVRQWRHREAIDPFDRACREAGLERHVRNIDLRGLTPRQAIELLERATGAKIRPDWESLHRAGVYPDGYQIMTLDVRDSTLEQVLLLLLGLNGGYEVRNGVIELGSRADFAHVARIYDLHGVVGATDFSRPYLLPPSAMVAGLTPAQRTALVQQLVAARARAAARAPATLPPTVSPLAGRRGGSGSVPPALLFAIPPLPSYRTIGDEQAVQICRRIMKELEDDWVTDSLGASLLPPPAPRGSARVDTFAGYLFVYQTRQRHREIRRMLEEISQRADYLR